MLSRTVGLDEHCRGGGAPGRQGPQSGDTRKAGWRLCCRGVLGLRGAQAQTWWQLGDKGVLVGFPVSVSWWGRGRVTRDKNTLSSELRKELTGFFWGKRGVRSFKGDLAVAASVQQI